jgi:hypothetical protein
LFNFADTVNESHEGHLLGSCRFVVIKSAF